MKRLRFSLLLTLSLSLSLIACGSSEEDASDVAAEVRDRGGRDTGTLRDTAMTDVFEDMRDSDTGQADTGGTTDTDQADTASSDTLPEDTGMVDAPPTDTGTPDTPPRDTGTPDVPDGLECSEKAELVYVVTKEKQLFAFDPRDGSLTLVGDVDCDEWLDTTPGSMGLTRLGTAYVNYSDGEVGAVSIEDAGCAPSGWTAQGGEFARFGMSFVGDGGEETLYVASASRLARLDTDSWRLVPIGDLPSQCELAGTSRGELWGFFPLESPPQIHRIDPTNAEVLESYAMPPLPRDLDTFAFTAWGGDFYIFYRVSGMGSSTDVYRYTPGDSAPELVIADTGINVVGAGVSICAPTSL